MTNTAQRQAAEVYFERSRKTLLPLASDLIKPYLKPGMRVLDVGCGTGNLCAFIANIVGANGSIVGIDPDADRINIATEKWKDLDNVKFLICKGSEMPIPKVHGLQYDFVVSFLAFHWMDEEEKRATLVNIHNSLRPSGIAVIQLNLKLDHDINSIIPYLTAKESHFINNMLVNMPDSDVVPQLCKVAGFQDLRLEVIDDSVILHNFDDVRLFFFAHSRASLDIKGVEDTSRRHGCNQNSAITLPLTAQRLIIQKPSR